MTYKGHKIAGRCFASNAGRIVMPAFGAFTGGLDIRDSAIRTLFGDGFDVTLLARGRIIPTASGRR